MEIETIRKLIKKKVTNDLVRIAKMREAELYYENANDILRKRNPTEEKLAESKPKNPMKNADNRISHPWHSLLVNQKAAYAMTVPPYFDVDDKEINAEIVKLLGDRYPKIAKDLAVNASNTGVAWLHVWKDEKYKNFFRYAIVDSKQIIPIYSKKLDGQLEGVLRVYEDYDDAGDTLKIYEYWNANEVSTYSQKKESDFDSIESYNCFNLLDVGTGDIAGKTNVYTHDWGRIPFIPFRNNPLEQSDLQNYKKLIDVYDQVYSGFVNDIDDIQEIIFVLTNYSGEDKKEFLDDLKQYKMVKVEDDGQGAKSGVDTLAVDIPIEARDKLLEITRESIFVHGQGVDPQRNIGQNNSGAALRYMYSLLELKASMMETEFRLGFAELIRFILIYSGKDADITVKQSWTRTSINNDLEQADIISKLANVTSDENIAKANPLVEDWETELANQKKEEESRSRMDDDYQDESSKKGIEDEEAETE